MGSLKEEEAEVPEAIPSSPIASYAGDEANTHFTTTSFQAVVENDQVTPEPLLLQTKQSQFPQPLLIKFVLQIPHSFLALLWVCSRASMSFL